MDDVWGAILGLVLLVGLIVGGIWLSESISEHPHDPYAAEDRAFNERADLLAALPPFGVLATADEYGDAWPLTVPGVRVELLSGCAAVVHTTTATYALNGVAIRQGYPRINPIWKDNPRIPGAKVNIGPLLDLALSLGDCLH